MDCGLSGSFLSARSTRVSHKAKALATTTAMMPSQYAGMALTSPQVWPTHWLGHDHGLARAD